MDPHLGSRERIKKRNGNWESVLYTGWLFYAGVVYGTRLSVWDGGAGKVVGK